MSSLEATEETSRTQEELAAQLAIVEAENERLRQEYARARQTAYRRTALGLGFVGVLSAIGAFVIPSARTILFALGGTGIFAGLLTVYLTPERFIAASIGEEVYTALAENESSIASELGLADVQVYVPSSEENGSAHLYIPQDSDDSVPPSEALESAFVIEDGARGLSLHPTGAALLTEFDRALSDEMSHDPQLLADQLADGLVEQFELVRRGVTEASEGRITIAVSGSAYGDVGRFDHPVPSFIATGIAQTLRTPVRVTIHAGDDPRTDQLVTCTWDTSETAGAEAGKTK